MTRAFYIRLAILLAACAVGSCAERSDQPKLRDPELSRVEVSANKMADSVRTGFNGRYSVMVHLGDVRGAGRIVGLAGAPTTGIVIPGDVLNRILTENAALRDSLAECRWAAKEMSQPIPMRFPVDDTVWISPARLSR